MRKSWAVQKKEYYYSSAAGLYSRRFRYDPVLGQGFVKRDHTPVCGNCCFAFNGYDGCRKQLKCASKVEGTFNVGENDVCEKHVFRK